MFFFKVLDAACNDNQGILNYVYNSQFSRAISIMFLPWTLPVEFSVNFSKKLDFSKENIKWLR